MNRQHGLAGLTAGVVLVLAGAVGPLQGQALGAPLGVDVRAEVAFPLGDFADIAGTGAGFSIGAALGVLPGAAIYGNYSDIRFGGGWTGDGTADARDSGFAVGVSAALPGGMWASPWVGAGLLFHRLEVRGSTQGVSQDMGFEVGGGVAIPVADRVRISPSLNYRHYGASIPAIAGLAARDITVQHLALGLGLNVTF
jgi:opacity protein-like surface antigen